MLLKTASKKALNKNDKEYGPGTFCWDTKLEAFYLPFENYLGPFPQFLLGRFFRNVIRGSLKNVS